MKKGENDKERLQHIVKAASFILLHTEGKDEDSFLRDEVLKYAILKQIEIIGEAAYYLSNELKAMHGQVEWDLIIGARHIYVHHYFQVNWLIVWEITKNDIPKLEKEIQKILNEL